MIISMHTPKAGGTSFKLLLENHFENKIRLDYSDLPLNNDFHEVKKSANLFYWKFALKKRVFNYYKDVECIHGHFLIHKYSNLTLSKENKFITWLRDPISRLVSHYYFWKRTYTPNDNSKLRKRMLEENWSFEDFAFSNEMKNVYSKFMYRFPVDRFDFIGITEYFDEDVKYFAKYFLGLNEITVPKVNVAPNKTESDQLNPKMIEDLKNYHSIDYNIYEYALKKRNNRLDYRKI